MEKDKPNNEQKTKIAFKKPSGCLSFLIPRAITVRLVDSILRKTKLQIIGEENLGKIKEILKDRSAVLIFHHTSHLESTGAVRIMEDQLGIRPEDIGLIISHKFIDGRLDPIVLALTSYQQNRGINMFPIIQDYDGNYPDGVKLANNLGSLRNAKRFLREQGHAVAVVPEGTRSPGVRRALAGIVSLITTKGNIKEPVVVPLTFAEINGDSQYKVLTTGLTVTVGKPIEPAQIRQDSETYGLPIQDVVMLYLTRNMPVGTRGYYEGLHHPMFQKFYDDNSNPIMGSFSESQIQNEKELPKSVAVIGMGQIGTFLTREITENIPLVQVLVGMRSDNIKMANVRRRFADHNVEVSSVQEALRNNPQIIFVATQNPIDEILNEIEQHVVSGSTLVFLQNGVDVIGKAIERFGLDRFRLVKGCVFTPVTGEEYNLRKRRIALAPVAQNAETQKATLQAASLLESIGFHVAQLKDYKGMEWEKLLSNLFGTTGSITGLSLGDTIRDRELFQIELEGLRDRIALLDANDVILPEIPWSKEIYMLRKLPIPVALLLRPVIAKKASKERNQPNATARRIQAGRSTEAQWYHKPFEASHLDEIILEIIQDHETGIIDLNNLSLQKKKELLIGRYKAPFNN